MMLGSLMLINTSAPYLRISWAVIITTTVVTVLFFVFVVGLGLRAQRRRPTTGRRGMVGERGQAVTNVGPNGGRVFVHGENWQAVAKEEIAAGAEVEVVAADRMRLEVKRVT